MTDEMRKGLQRFYEEAARRAEAGDLFAIVALAAVHELMAPREPPEPPGGGETVIDLSAYRLKLAA